MTEARTSADGGMETSYGFRKVADGEKQGLVNDVFHKVAKRYDVMNDVMSAGMHRVWKDALIASLNPRKDAGYKTLDVAGGTGDVAFRIVEASDRKAHVTVLDINGSMLAVGAERAEKKRLSENLAFVEANAESLPFEANSFDAYTIAFGIRNVPHIDVALKEAYRVLEARRTAAGAGIFRSRDAASRALLRGMVVQGDPALRQDDHRRSRALPIPGGIDPEIPEPGKFRGDDPQRGFLARHLHQLYRRHRGAAFRLEALNA